MNHPRSRCGGSRRRRRSRCLTVPLALHRRDRAPVISLRYLRRRGGKSFVPRHRAVQSRAPHQRPYENDHRRLRRRHPCRRPRHRHRIARLSISRIPVHPTTQNRSHTLPTGIVNPYPTSPPSGTPPRQTTKTSSGGTPNCTPNNACSPAPRRVRIISLAPVVSRGVYTVCLTCVSASSARSQNRPASGIRRHGSRPSRRGANSKRRDEHILRVGVAIAGGGSGSPIGTNGASFAAFLQAVTS
jgi:hypothetical protein